MENTDNQSNELDKIVEGQAITYNHEYPRLALRYQATVVDGLVIVAGLVTIGSILSLFESAPGYLRAMAFVVVAFLYEPLMVSRGGTLGHRWMGLKVKSRSNPHKNVFVILALLRFAAKIALGWLSFITMLFSSDNQAIHDMLSDSVVLYKDQFVDEKDI